MSFTLPPWGEDLGCLPAQRMFEGQPGVGQRVRDPPGVSDLDLERIPQALRGPVIYLEPPDVVPRLDPDVVPNVSQVVEDPLDRGIDVVPDRPPVPGPNMPVVEVQVLREPGDRPDVDEVDGGPAIEGQRRR